MSLRIFSLFRLVAAASSQISVPTDFDFRAAAQSISAELSSPSFDKQELIDIIDTIYRSTKKGRGQVVSPKDYSTRYWY
ncbi:uncharacterized protein BDZ99DRAFT_513748 [Mytilinidion resinicola]|uniref:Uncharacterized protein n=1 Tax=Mytilinidion resinicola TaxID=574789 RepID=A0A6A6ZB22_9PEZI|nr:uncharacterized protein BDZ99DRAFT_513748 [Mytilinidion resinicola]KAF2817505.1 hypothetical protein BDZ99DRAFT_513748 [Mytilinidion resinicola]